MSLSRSPLLPSNLTFGFSFLGHLARSPLITILSILLAFTSLSYPFLSRDKKKKHPAPHRKGHPFYEQFLALQFVFFTAVCPPLPPKLFFPLRFLWGAACPPKKENGLVLFDYLP